MVSGIKSTNIHSVVCDFGACLVPAIEPISSLYRRVVYTRILSPSLDPQRNFLSSVYLFLHSLPLFSSDMSLYPLRAKWLSKHSFLCLCPSRPALRHPVQFSIRARALTASGIRLSFANSLTVSVGRLPLLFLPRRFLIHFSRKSAT